MITATSGATIARSSAPFSRQKAAAKPAAAKRPATKPAKAARQIVPFDEVNGLLAELGLSKGQLAKATGKSTSLVSEWTGHGRKTGLNANAWPAVQKAARAFAKGMK